jgi:hypothetical protein
MISIGMKRRNQIQFQACELTHWEIIGKKKGRTVNSGFGETEAQSDHRTLACTTCTTESRRSSPKIHRQSRMPF